MDKKDCIIVSILTGLLGGWALAWLAFPDAVYAAIRALWLSMKSLFLSV